jgi:hypothetical protein
LRIFVEEFEAYFGDNNLSNADLLEMFNLPDKTHILLVESPYVVKTKIFQ